MSSRRRGGKLRTYRKKRRFGRTPEPGGGGKRSGKRPRFVIQEHDATSLHYDLRLEVGGVLKSWAVPKGPSLDPRERRLAIPTEDHPMSYKDFEGVIPEGEYGAGTVLLWDRGTYRNLKEEEGKQVPMARAWKKGHLVFRLYGKKLRGGFSLVRTERKRRGKAQWLLVKMDDDDADARRNPVSTEPESVKSGRTLKEIAREEA